MTDTPKITEAEAGCVFCHKLEDGTVQREALRVYSFEPLNPVTPGHRLFIVDQHFAYPHHEPTLAGLAFSAAARYAGEQGGAYNLIVNAGDAASQTIPHVHVHYVPRERNDGLHLPWTESDAVKAQTELPAEDVREALIRLLTAPHFDDERWAYRVRSVEAYPDSAVAMTHNGHARGVDRILARFAVSPKKGQD